MLGLAGHDRIDMIKRLFGPIRDVRPAGNDADAKFTITVGERIGATGKSGEERERDNIGLGIYLDRAYLLVDDLDVVLGKSDCREVDTGHWRHEVRLVAPAISRRVADDYPHLHGGPHSRLLQRHSRP